jgi:hypothetical protein
MEAEGVQPGTLEEGERVALREALVSAGMVDPVEFDAIMGA